MNITKYNKNTNVLLLYMLNQEKLNGRGVFYVWEKIEVHTEFWWVDLKEKGHLEDIGVDGRQY